MISIITVNYNSGNEILETFKSVFSQTVKGFEYIVIDGGSNDNSINWIQKYASKIDVVVSEKDKGIYDAMNKGVSSSKYNWILFLNSGDLLHDNQTIEKLNSIIINTDPLKLTKSSMIYGKTEIVSETSSHVQNPKKLNKLNLCLFGTRTICHQSTFYNKSIFKGYNLEFSLKGELDSYFELIRNNEVLYAPLIISKFKTGGRNNKYFIENARQTLRVIIKHCGILSILSLPSIFFRLFRNIPYLFKS